MAAAPLEGSNSSCSITSHLSFHPPSSSSVTSLSFSSKPTSLNKKKKKPILECVAQPPLTVIPKDTPESTPNPQTPLPHWKLNSFQRAAAIAIDAMERAFISRELQRPLPQSADPAVQLAGNFAPVPEQPVHYSLPITGTIPDCLNGVYLRNGPNPFFKPNAGHHFFDGDGMVHAVTIRGGAASYACRFIETERMVQERTLGRPVFPRPAGEIQGHAGIVRLLIFFLRGAIGVIDGRRGTGPANTGLVFFNGKLLAMSEEDLPYELEITPAGDLRTIGRYSFDGQLHSSMIAHPKIDPQSGDLHTLSYTVPKPNLTYLRFSPDGKKSAEINIDLESSTMVHDFAITENFIVIPDHQVVFKLEEMIKNGSPVIFDEKKKPRFGILAKNAENGYEIVWVESRDTFCFHLWNAWEEAETEEVVVIASCMKSLRGSIFNDGGEGYESVLTEIRLNLKTRESTRRLIVKGMQLEVGTVNKKRLGRKTRFVYVAVIEAWPKVTGLAKVDVVTGEVKRHDYGEGRFGGEPFFVKTGGGDGEEDDGYVLALVHDETTCESELQIINGVSLEVEATVKLPSRVPYGLHGTFVHANDLPM